MHGGQILLKKVQNPAKLDRVECRHCDHVLALSNQVNKNIC